MRGCLDASQDALVSVVGALPHEMHDASGGDVGYAALGRAIRDERRESYVTFGDAAAVMIKKPLAAADRLGDAPVLAFGPASSGGRKAIATLRPRC